MAYSPSLSKREFINKTETLLANLKIMSNKKPVTIGKPAPLGGATPLEKPLMQMLFQAAIFRTSALLEDYIKDSITDWLLLANNYGSNCSSLPENLKWYLVSISHGKAYKEYYYSSDEKALLEKLNSAPSNDFLEPAKSISGILSSGTVVGNRKYPSIRNIKVLFNRIGVANIFHRLNSATKRDMEKVLQSFLDIREDIAHQEPADLIYVEVNKNIRNMQSIVKSLDRILYAHVNAYHGEKCWRIAR